MDPAVGDGRLEGDFADDVRHMVDRIGRLGVQETAATRLLIAGHGETGARYRHRRGGDRRVRGRADARRAARILRLLGRDGHPKLVAEILGQADARLTGPGEAGDVLCVDRRRNDFVARRYAFALQGRERPALAGEEMQAHVVPIDRAVEIADAQVVGIAFVRVGRIGGTEEIELAIKGRDRRGVDGAFDQTRYAALAGGEAQFVHPRERSIFSRNATERDVGDVRTLVALAPQTFRREEAAGSDGDAAHMDFLIREERRLIGRGCRRIGRLQLLRLLRLFRLRGLHFRFQRLHLRLQGVDLGLELRGIAGALRVNRRQAHSNEHERRNRGAAEELRHAPDHADGVVPRLASAAVWTLCIRHELPPK